MTSDDIETGLEVDGGGITRGSGIQIDRGSKPMFVEISILLANFNLQQDVHRNIRFTMKLECNLRTRSNSAIKGNNDSRPIGKVSSFARIDKILELDDTGQ